MSLLWGQQELLGVTLRGFTTLKDDSRTMFNNLGGFSSSQESVKQTSSFQGARVRESGSYT